MLIQIILTCFIMFHNMKIEDLFLLSFIIIMTENACAKTYLNFLILIEESKERYLS